jgi:peptide-methionine (R)-S-oxide reductase
VTQGARTEPPFNNEFWAHREARLYVDVVSAEPLFASTKRYDSGGGWPSFTALFEIANMVRNSDVSFAMIRDKVYCAEGGSHRRHVFTDGPVDEGGLRYCMKSAAPRFVSYEELDGQGYGQYCRLFETSEASEGMPR